MSTIICLALGKHSGKHSFPCFSFLTVLSVKDKHMSLVGVTVTRFDLILGKEVEI